MTIKSIEEIEAALAPLSFSHGAHAKRDDGMCVMEAVAYIAGERHTDHPQCVSEMLSGVMIRFNDRLRSDADRNRRLKPLVPLLIGTRTTAADDITRGFMATDWLIRWRLPSALRIAGLEAEAQELEALAPVVDAATARIARDASKVAGKKIRQVRDERWMALGSNYGAAGAAGAAAADAAADDADDADVAATAADAAAAAADAAAAAAAEPLMQVAKSAAEQCNGTYWDKRNAAYRACRKYLDNGGTNPVLGAYKANIEKHRESFSALVRRMCQVGR